MGLAYLQRYGSHVRTAVLDSGSLLSVPSKTPRFRCHLGGFRHVSNDSLALAFPVPT